jgi:hypothetical protein
MVAAAAVRHTLAAQVVLVLLVAVMVALIQVPLLLLAL